MALESSLRNSRIDRPQRDRPLYLIRALVHPLLKARLRSAIQGPTNIQPFRDGQGGAVNQGRVTFDNDRALFCNQFVCSQDGQISDLNGDIVP